MTPQVYDGAWDCHAHVYGPASQYPAVNDPNLRPDDRRYETPDAPVKAYLSELDAKGFAGGVIVQPNVYGTDHRYLLAALAASKGRLRGVAVLSDYENGELLESLENAGVTGARVHFPSSTFSWGNLERLADCLSERSWYLQIYPAPGAFSEIVEGLHTLRATIVLDHFAGLRPDTDFNLGPRLLRLVERQNIWIKLSAPYRVSNRPDFQDLAPLVRQLVRIAPERLLWGSDWPHPGLSAPIPRIDDLLTRLSDWLGNEKNLRQVLVENPRNLLGLASG